jgi:hypothetical protein
LGRPLIWSRGSDGWWTVTTTPLVVGFHYYSIVVDGATVADPATRTFFGPGWDNSGIEIPEAADVNYFTCPRPNQLHSRLPVDVGRALPKEEADSVVSLGRPLRK